MALLKRQRQKNRLLVSKARRIAKSVLPDALETIKWGSITYVVNGKNLLGIHVYRDHVNLEFFNGARLRSKLLEGTGKGLRHIKAWPGRGVDEAEFSRLLKEAEKLAV